MEFKRKKHQTIEAILFKDDITTANELNAWGITVETIAVPSDHQFLLKTDDGVLYANVGDFIFENSEGDMDVLCPEAFYKLFDDNSFVRIGDVMNSLNNNECIARKSWPTGRLLYLLNGTQIQNKLQYGYGEYAGEPIIKSCLVLKDEYNNITLGYCMSFDDINATDWTILN